MRHWSHIIPRLSAIAVLAASVFQAAPRAQQVGRTPVDVVIPQPPAPAVALGRIHLVYELHATNFGSSPAVLEQIEVMDGRQTVLASWSGAQLWQRIRLLGAPEAARTAHALQPGGRAIAYLWVTLRPGAAAPDSLAHRLTFSGESGERETVTTAGMSLATSSPPVGSPVRGGPWVAVRGPSQASGHRLSLVTLDGRTRVPQRFAVDLALLGPDGLLFHGDRAQASNWYGYDAPVYAAAAGTVALVRDGSPDRPAFGTAPPVIEAVDAPGNVVVIEIAPQRYLTYAHLRPGSLRVSRGDRVAEGQLLGRIGNSGNSGGPHLHFQLTDAAEPLSGEGLPFSWQAFELIGRIGSLQDLLANRAWTSNPQQPARMVSAEMPLENMVVQFESDGTIGQQTAPGGNRP
jgi:hypothetical protein